MIGRGPRERVRFADLDLFATRDVRSRGLMRSGEGLACCGMCGSSWECCVCGQSVRGFTVDIPYWLLERGDERLLTR